MPKITKAILTGGGRATRLRPITTTINKHLIPLANRPMIFHAIEKVAKAGVKEIFINTNPGDTELEKCVGDGSRWNVKIKFFEQEGGPQGIAHVVKQAQKFIGDDPFIFYLSDNIVLGDLNHLVEEFDKNNHDCLLAFSKVPDPHRFGVPVFGEGGRLVDIVEKPANPASDFAVTGIYLYGPKIFFDAFENIKKSKRGEFEISDIHSYFLKNGHKVGYKEVTGWWKDTGKPEDLLAANALLLAQELGDKVSIGENTKIGEGVKIVGPAIIGNNCVLENCLILPNSVVGAGCEIKNAEIGNSLIFENCKIDSAIKIHDSIIGKGATLIQKNGDNRHRVILGDNTQIVIPTEP